MYQKVLSAHQSLEDGGRGSWRGRVRGRGQRPGRKLLRMHQDPMTELSGDVHVCQDKDWGVATGFDNGKLIIDPEKSNLVKVIWAKPWCQWTQ